MKLETSDGYQAAYEYDDAGNLIRVVAPHFERLLRYDTFGRLISEVYPLLSQEVRYAYDMWGRRTKLEVVGGLKISYAYDKQGRLVSIDCGQKGCVDFAYDEAGRRSKVSYSNGMAIVYQYDAASLVSQLAYVDRSGDPVEIYDYEHDSAHRVVQQTDRKGQTHVFRYDTNGQLVQATSDASVQTFRYSPGLRRASESLSTARRGIFNTTRPDRWSKRVNVKSPTTDRATWSPNRPQAVQPPTSLMP